jgi:hypothetical protein
MVVQSDKSLSHVVFCPPDWQRANDTTANNFESTGIIDASSLTQSPSLSCRARI